MISQAEFQKFSLLKSLDQVHNLSFENEFRLHGNEKWFPYQRLSTYPRFDTEPRGNSEMAYYSRPWNIVFAYTVTK